MNKDILLTIKEASIWATNYIGRNVTPSNISYLIQYGRIKKIGDNGSVQVSQAELLKYYDSYNFSRETDFKNRLGQDLNWALSFDQYKEAETTKHVHRLHPYKGKFIPQLVEYFIDEHTDNFKTSVFFKKGNIILDPFSGSGTTLVQSCEQGIHAIGIDVSAFNSMIGNCKITKYDMPLLKKEIKNVTDLLKEFVAYSKISEFEEKLLSELNNFNDKYFSSPDYKYNLRIGEIDESEYAYEKAKKFLPIYNKLLKQYKIKLFQKNSTNFLEKWYFKHIRTEIDFVFEEIKKIQNIDIKQIMSIILSRTLRSCRATTHSDLATLLKPIKETYYCKKHGKVCKPLFSILKWWESYTKDTLSRLLQFDKLRTDTYQYNLTGDSKTINIFSELKNKNAEFAKLAKKQKINGIFSSPPYVGLINYHEQHAYAYDLFGFDRKDELEIGPLFKGQKQDAKQSYVQGISDVLNNCKKYLTNDYNVFLVANDKYNLYPEIAENAGMRIVNCFKRPVLNRTEKDKTAYSEIIFHMKKK